jgi:hypothetical protein
MRRRTNVVLAILTAALLLGSTLSACASISTNAPADPCCPSKQPLSDNCLKGCVCAGLPHAPIAVPANTDGGVVVDLAEIGTAGAALEPLAAPSAFLPDLHSPPDRYLTFHQLLV